MFFTNFGFKKVPSHYKEKLVQNVFSGVAHNYDFMNDAMSLFLHRSWKSDMAAELRPGLFLLDLAGGTGDIAKRFVNEEKIAMVYDLNDHMLAVGKNKAEAEHFIWKNQLRWRKGNAEDMPFANNTFDLCSCAFGVRNFTNIAQSLAEIYRVLKPGGKFVCLEFSRAPNPLISKLYDLYAFNWIPLLGEMLANDRAAYQYLVESIAQFHTAEEFSNVLEEAGFESVWFSRKAFGIVAMHTGYKI